MIAAAQDRAREVVERVERLRRVEVVVDRVAHTLRVRRGIGAGRALGCREQAVQERAPLFDVGVVPLERVAVVVTRGARAGSRAGRRSSTGR